MSLDFRQANVVNLSKRGLGEAYLLGVAIILTGVLAAVGVLKSDPVHPWMSLAVFPVGGFAGLTYWMRLLQFERVQVWRVAMYAAVGTGLVTVCIFGLHFMIRFLTVSPLLTIGLTMTIAVSTAGGALLGITIESQRATQQLSARNMVLHQILRHNLRNDMTVVLGHVENVKSSVEESEREQLAVAERKIHALVNLVDNIRQVNTSIQPGEQSTQPIDLVSQISERVKYLRRTHPAITLTTDLPDQAWVCAEEQFRLVIDNIVESAIMYSNNPPTLHIEVAEENGSVFLKIDDVEETIPEADLSVLAETTDGTLSHGRGVELWLVSWLTERSNGTVSLTTDGPDRRITITLRRAKPQPTIQFDQPASI